MGYNVIIYMVDIMLMVVSINEIVLSYTYLILYLLLIQFKLMNYLLCFTFLVLDKL
uniref:Uncharacterized protein n=1 Tax=Daphnia magna TaxID=35525 RepID=A0A0P6A0J9_9CRUS